MYSIDLATLADAPFIARCYEANQAALHGEPIALEDWRAVFETPDPDEQHAIIRCDATPCAWLKLNGLASGDDGWVSMLVVLPEYQRQGAGTFALAYAEEALRRLGKTRIGLHTTADNLPALTLYRRAGYTVVEQQDCRWGDGLVLPDCTLIKTL